MAAGLLLAIFSMLLVTSGSADRRLSLHMVLQMADVALVVPLLAYGLGPRLGRLGSIHPIVGILSLNLVLFAAQLPAVVDAGARSVPLRELVAIGVMLGSFLFWCPVVGSGRLTSIAKIGTLMVASVPPTIPGLTLALSHHVFYQAYRSLEDQQLAGLVLFGTAKLALVGGAFVVLWRLLTPEEEPDDRDDRDLSGDDLPPTAPAWLRRLDGELAEEAPPARVPALTRD
jgi:cytochrome c oxidase assembly factor CtaG